jgi:hypothetical protein
MHCEMRINVKSTLTILTAKYDIVSNSYQMKYNISVVLDTSIFDKLLTINEVFATMYVRSECFKG